MPIATLSELYNACFRSIGSLGIAVMVTPAVALLAGGSATAARTGGSSRHIPESRSIRPITSQVDMLESIRSSSEDHVSNYPKPAVATPLNPRRRGIIIGASDGIGAALARRLAREGYTLALLARRADKLESLCSEINQTQGEQRAQAYVHDVAEYEKAPALLRRIVADLGGVDLVVFVAGVNHPPDGIDQYNFQNDRTMIETNLIGALAWLNPVAEMFQSARAGQIVGIGSVAGDRGRVGNPGYNTSKAGLATYLEALRNRLSRYGINVLTVKPGFVQTEMLKAAQGPTPFTITAEKAADDIWNAMRKRKQVVYTASIWRWIMLAIQHTPSSIFRRLSF